MTGCSYPTLLLPYHSKRCVMFAFLVGVDQFVHRCRANNPPGLAMPKLKLRDGEVARSFRLHVFVARMAFLGGALVPLAPAAGQTHSSHPVEMTGSPCRPIHEKRGAFGCYTLATERLGRLPQHPLFWHLDIYPTREAADAARGPQATVVEAFGGVWLFTIAQSAWHSSGGRRVAKIGPIPLPADLDFMVMYVEATFLPGGSLAPHKHSGPELWYTLSGEQCLETPEGKLTARAGESTIVPGGTPMAPLAVGSETPRSLILVLHDATQPPSASVVDWAPKGLCSG